MAARNAQLSTLAIALGLFGAIAAPAAQATNTLLNVTQTFPDVTLSTPSLIYDNTGGASGTGVLKIVSVASVLNEGAAASDSTDTQSYFGAGDNVADLILTINVTGTGSFVSGTVDIHYGNSTTEPRWDWSGTVTGFGFNDGAASGRIMDATWTVTSDDYLNMPSTLSQFVNGYMTGGAGGIIITSSKGFNDGESFASDWVLANNATAASITSFTSGLTSPTLVSASTMTVDVFATPVPEASTYGMMLAGLAMLAPLARRKRLSPL